MKMKNHILALSSLSVALLVSGCSGPDGALFLTTTKIAIDGDTSEQAVSIGYDRFEGFIAPAYETGAVPPVLAKIDANLSLLEPRVKQFYATGNAAVLVTCGDTTAVKATASTVTKATNPQAVETIKCPETLERLRTGDRRTMVFGTGTVGGLKVSWISNSPDSITFGYKRREFSWLPIIPEKKATPGQTSPSAATVTTPPLTVAEEGYGSVLAAFDLDNQTTTPQNTVLGIKQFFATGAAAEGLAQTTGMRDLVKAEFTDRARTALNPLPTDGKPGTPSPSDKPN
jgi:hypothetical protein